ncbi:PTS sugar transporter subunit IIA [Pediococcus acidilactici]|uniref:PTS sugar transporter subunit IIA n=1 Tax=Pediococcus acidilactici TaxID=1254 RepID=UPI0039BF0D93
MLTVKNVKTAVEVSSRDELLKYLANLAVKNRYSTDAKAVYQKYLAREKAGSTGMERGIAIPHAQDASIKNSAMLVVKLQKPITWQTFDQQPVDTIISFLIPEQDQGNHLKYLSATSKLLMHEQFVTQLKQTNEPTAIYQLFNQ